MNKLEGGCLVGPHVRRGRHYSPSPSLHHSGIDSKTLGKKEETIHSKLATQQNIPIWR